MSTYFPPAGSDYTYTSRLTYASGTYEINNSDFLGISSSTNGGAISRSSSARISIFMCYFAGCTSSRNGGAIYSSLGSNGQISVSKTIGTSCETTSSTNYYGQFIYSTFSSSSSIQSFSQCSISKCSQSASSSNRAPMYLNQGTLTLNSINLSENAVAYTHSFYLSGTASSISYVFVADGSISSATEMEFNNFDGTFYDTMFINITSGGNKKISQKFFQTTSSTVTFNRISFINCNLNSEVLVSSQRFDSSQITFIDYYAPGIRTNSISVSNSVSQTEYITDYYDEEDLGNDRKIPVPDETPHYSPIQTQFATFQETPNETPYITPLNTPCATFQETQLMTLRETPFNTPFNTFQETNEPIISSQTQIETTQETQTALVSTATQISSKSVVTSSIISNSPTNTQNINAYNSSVTQNDQSNGSVNSISKGTLIGIFSSCAGALIIIAILVAFIILRKKKNSYTEYNNSDFDSIDNDDESLNSVDIPIAPAYNYDIATTTETFQTKTTDIDWNTRNSDADDDNDLFKPDFMLNEMTKDPSDDDF
ncbi:hypothetical protein TVAG_489370 [Trichomonas vaginalis G3]|uniref:Polymorphic outer membrane protein n=1 Tax=Trichomonas vaginalis (strain ATCC PRA-98 / G3) TaxID=412133 RepID=A2EVE7_TRIV3|nr:bifunctional inhibitor/lipid-transfer protein/seed storage 2s albumin superfamily protein family [Trichomonas vaginalis G3]EAY03393.1 hypothetical protein TVAG_489370 [Trichomonas vaginalis G3]KAI5538073.1 bifunctional inhibitor/lipid-transfer protein/seed storage 2s albumin superfamily protein family [Trichomonas vaginalis G3]|eukprot:XP_001315616.1 hypothetical protein [Trichomonas vaginalis G3]